MFCFLISEHVLVLMHVNSRAYVRRHYSLENITWSELGKQKKRSSRMMKYQEAREDKVLSCQEVYVWYKGKHT